MNPTINDSLVLPAIVGRNHSQRRLKLLQEQQNEVHRLKTVSACFIAW
ncbi:hypothetical protein [Novosphingobium aquae]|uniref:Uncharacterized protein n=1 Tax=Novosphingobium aquae TaxID=3133435 RepID=A0ABU8SCT8_9SPHN